MVSARACAPLAAPQPIPQMTRTRASPAALGAHTSWAASAHLLRAAATCQGTCPGNTLPGSVPASEMLTFLPGLRGQQGGSRPTCFLALSCREALGLPRSDPCGRQVDRTLSRAGPGAGSRVMELSWSVCICWKGQDTQ